MVFDKFSRRMYAVCLRYANSNFEAEDLMITGFTKVFENIHKFKGEGSFEGWIRRIMVNECLMQIRKSQPLYVELSGTESDDKLTDAAMPNADAEELMELLERLPTGYRTVFNLYAIEGYKHEEIAEMLGISENTSKSQLSRARAMLQRWITDLNKDSLNVRR